jgi:hypothetical protein
MDKDVKVTLKENDTKAASKIYTKLIKFAKKLEDAKLTSKYEAELAKLPPITKKSREKEPLKQESNEEDESREDESHEQE